MRARSWGLAGVVVVAAGLGAGSSALAEPKPTSVDVKPLKDKAQVFQDAKGGTYVVVAAGDEPAMFYGATGKILYEQVVTGRSRNGDEWSINVKTPRLAETRRGSIDRKADGTFQKWCDGKDDLGLSELTGEKARAVLDKYQFMTPALVYAPAVLARDDSGVYYYVDKLLKQYGSKGYRVWIGKKGAMKLTPLTDVAIDPAGEVYATKSGDLRLVHNRGDSPTGGAQWTKGGKVMPLMQLDLDVNSPLIYSELGVYTFLGTICDNVSY